MKCSSLRHVFICIHAFELVARIFWNIATFFGSDKPGLDTNTIRKRKKKSKLICILIRTEWKMLCIDTCLIVSIAVGIAWIILLNFAEFHIVILPTIFLRYNIFDIRCMRAWTHFLFYRSQKRTRHGHISNRETTLRKFYGTMQTHTQRDRHSAWAPF